MWLSGVIGGGSSVDRARNSWWGGRGFDPRCGHPLPTGWDGVSIMWPADTEVMASPLCLCQYNVTGWCRSHGIPALSRVKLSDVSLGTRPRYSSVTDEDVKKPMKQTNSEVLMGWNSEDGLYSLPQSSIKAMQVLLCGSLVYSLVRARY